MPFVIDKFINYLKDFELTELEELGLLNEEKIFSKKILEDFEEEREKILASAIANT